MEVRMICIVMNIAGDLEHTKPTEQAKGLKIPSLRKTIPGGRHMSKTRRKRINRNIANGKCKKNKSTPGLLRFYPLKTLIILAKQLYRTPPLTSRTESIAAEVGRSNQPVIRKPNRCATIPYFWWYIRSNRPNFAGEVKTGILLGLTFHKRWCIIQHNIQPLPHCWNRRPIFF